MRLSELNLYPQRLGTEKRVALVVVADTIKSAHADPKLCGDATIQDCLEALEGEQGDQITQGIIAQYLGDEKAEAASGVPAEYNIRLLANSQNITAAKLKQEMINQLKQHLHLPTE